MFDTWLFIALAVAAIVAVAIYVFAWRATAGKSTLIKALVRVVLPVFVLASAAAAVLLPEVSDSKKMAEAEPPTRFEYRVDKSKPKAKYYRKPAARSTNTAGLEAERARREAAERKQVEANRRARYEAQSNLRGEAERAARTQREIQDQAMNMAPPPPPPAPAPPESISDVSPGGGGASSAPVGGASVSESGGESSEEIAAAVEPDVAVTRSMVPPSGESDWDVVPVFFGTDRQRADNASRLNYVADRGRRLELGHALVSVPKSHQVPNIERPWVLRIPYFDVTIYEETEDPKKHFVMREIKALARDDFLRLVRARLAASKTFKDQAFVFVHGFNTSFEHSVYRTAQIAYDLKFDGAPFLYSWPSGDGVSSYTYDRESSGQSIPYMRDFIKMVLNETGAKAVSVIAHSMGNQPILQVLKDLKNATPDDVVISQVILAAPDVDRDNFENIAKEILGLAKRVTLYVASNDQALQFSRRFHGGVPRAGDIPSNGPLIIPGIDTIDVTAASTDSLGINHSGYAENNALLKDIERLLATGAPPAERHPPKFERVEQTTGSYWRYPSAN